MKKLTVAILACAAWAATPQHSQAYVNYPWCAHGDSRGMECVFTSREQCAADGRTRGFGTLCIRNPNFNPSLPAVVPTARRARPDGVRPLGSL